MSPYTEIIYADAVLFDMDGTLTDSISAVEAAWNKIAKEIGQDSEYVISATHGKRAIDNLSQFKPHLRDHEMEREVEIFEQSILFFADAHRLHGNSLTAVTPEDSFSNVSSPPSSFEDTPFLSTGSTGPPSRASSTASRRPSFGHHLLNMLSVVSRLRGQEQQQQHKFPVGVDDEENLLNVVGSDEKESFLEPWQSEAACVDRSVRILPGVRRMIDSIPEGRYAVATSGAKTYAYGCMQRVGITPPPVTITADDKRLKAGKPAPDPFLLAAECLGYDPRRCVVFEDSPSGIRAGVASGATVIAVCTSHDRSKLEGCGAHFIVENMESVACEVGHDDRLKFSISLL